MTKLLHCSDMVDSTTETIWQLIFLPRDIAGLRGLVELLRLIGVDRLFDSRIQGGKMVLTDENNWCRWSCPATIRVKWTLWGYCHTRIYGRVIHTSSMNLMWNIHTRGLEVRRWDRTELKLSRWYTTVIAISMVININWFGGIQQRVDVIG